MDTTQTSEKDDNIKTTATGGEDESSKPATVTTNEDKSEAGKPVLASLAEGEKKRYEEEIEKLKKKLEKPVVVKTVEKAKRKFTPLKWLADFWGF